MRGSRGSTNPMGESATYYVTKFSKKCMKMKKIGSTGGGDARPKFYYIDLLLLRLDIFFFLKT